MSSSGPEETVSVDLGTGGRRASLPWDWPHGSAAEGQARGWADHDPRSCHHTCPEPPAPRPPTTGGSEELPAAQVASVPPSRL